MQYLLLYVKTEIYFTKSLKTEKKSLCWLHANHLIGNIFCCVDWGNGRIWKYDFLAIFDHFPWFNQQNCASLTANVSLGFIGREHRIYCLKMDFGISARWSVKLFLLIIIIQVDSHWTFEWNFSTLQFKWISEMSASLRFPVSIDKTIWLCQQLDSDKM